MSVYNLKFEDLLARAGHLMKLQHTMAASSARATTKKRAEQSRQRYSSPPPTLLLQPACYDELNCLPAKERSVPRKEQGNNRELTVEVRRARELDVGCVVVGVDDARLGAAAIRTPEWRAMRSE
jgi:hypothetical protein